MDKDHRFFLTGPEAIAAIKLDFAQYKPQMGLFRDLCPLILGKTSFAIEDDKHDGVWLKTGDRKKMRKMSGRALGRFLCDMLYKNPPSLEVLAHICSRVFVTKACTGYEKDGKRQGIWLESGLDLFVCKQCGQCCATLAYHNECTAKDYAMWQALGRDDILDWVGIVKRGKTITGYQIWIDPHTHRFADICPWLDMSEGKKTHGCKIHDVKPEICISYPGTRKHAIMTGCRGFERAARKP